MSTAYVVWNGFFQHEQAIMKHSISQQMLPRGTALSFIPSDFFVCWCWSAPPPPLTETIKRKKKDEKAKSLADHWSMTQLWKSLLSNQIVQLEGAEVPQSCPGPRNVTDQLRGVNVHFSQLSRTCDGGKGKQRSTEVISLTNIESLKHLIGLWKRLKWLKLPNVQLPTQVAFAFVETHPSTF